jgi:hypothetical protein
MKTLIIIITILINLTIIYSLPLFPSKKYNQNIENVIINDNKDIALISFGLCNNEKDKLLLFIYIIFKCIKFIVK